MTQADRKMLTKSLGMARRGSDMGSENLLSSIEALSKLQIIVAQYLNGEKVSNIAAFIAEAEIALEYIKVATNTDARLVDDTRDNYVASIEKSITERSKANGRRV